jgi:hypothetical protein
MAGQNSKKKKGQKARAGGGKKSTPRSAAPSAPKEEEEYQGTMMGLRSGFKKVAAGESGKKSSNPIWSWLSWAALGAALLFVLNRFACQ